MSSRIIAAVAAVASATVAAALLVGGPAAAAAKNTVAGKVGPGYTISLTIGGKKAKAQGRCKYRFVVADRSEDHDFRLVGPRTSKMLSGEEFIGTKTTVLTLKKGTYKFFCALHAEDMRGGFTVS